MTIKDITGLNTESENDLREITARLSCFSAPGAREYTEKFHEHLALHGLAKLPPGFRSAVDIYQAISKSINLPIEYQQILGALERLAKRDKAMAENHREIEERYNEHAPEFRLTTERISGLTKEHNVYLNFEKSIMDEWRHELAARYPNLEPEDIQALENDLSIFSWRFYAAHSIESIVLYFGDNGNLEDLLIKMDEESLDDILPVPSNNLVATVRKIELPRFFYNASSQRRQYIMDKPISLLTK